MKNVIRAVLTLTVFTGIERALGFCFKIYLSRVLGAAALGVYQVALSFFLVLATLVTSGIPLIAAKMTAKFRASGDLRGEYSVTAAALSVNTAVSAIIIGLVFLLAKPAAGMFADPLSMTLLLFMLPAVLLSGVYAAFRGTLWGRKRYTTVSLVEMAEQVARILITVILFLLGFDKLKSAAAATSLSCLVSCLIVVICFFALKGKLSDPRPTLKPLLKSGTPITMVRASSSVINSLVAIAVPFLLTYQGMTNDQALAVFGSSVGMALPLLYIPITVVGSLAFVMIPTLSTAVAQNDTASIHKQISSAITFSVYVAALFLPVFYVLGEPIGVMVYGNAESGRFLSSASWLLIPISVENITSSMMNSLDLERKSFINYFIGSAVMFAFMFAFMGHFDINIYAIAMGLSLSVSTALDVIVIFRKTRVPLNFLTALVKAMFLIAPAIVLNKAFYIAFAFMPMLWRVSLTALISLVFMFGLNFVFGTFDVRALFGKKNVEFADKTVANKRKKRYTKQARL